MPATKLCYSCNVWRVKNKYIFENFQYNDDDICQGITYKTQDFYQIYRMHIVVQLATNCNYSTSEIVLSPPHDDWVKLNCVGAMENNGTKYWLWRDYSQ